MRSWSRTLTVLGSALPVLALSVVMVAPVSHASTSTASPVEDWTQEQVDARYQQYRERINQLLDEGKTQAEVDAAVAQEFGIVRLDNNTGLVPTADAMTTASNVTLYTPTFSYDSLLHKYVMAASWQWKQCSGVPCWHSERTSPGNLGGPDGMAVKINRAIFRYNAGISTNDNCGTPKINNNQADTDTGYGVGFVEQDTVYLAGQNCLGVPVGYNWHRGTVSETFTFQNPNCGGVQLQIDSKIGHTWSTTSVNSIGISTSGISFSWSSTNYRWNAIPATPAYAFC